jgi:hypothetical protein
MTSGGGGGGVMGSSNDRSGGGNVNNVKAGGRKSNKAGRPMVKVGDVLNDVDSVAICNPPFRVRKVCRGGRFGGIFIIEEEKALAFGGHDHDEDDHDGQLHKPTTAAQERRSKRPIRTSLRLLLLLLLLLVVFDLPRVDLLFSTPIMEAAMTTRKECGFGRKQLAYR